MRRKVTSSGPQSGREGKERVKKNKKSEVGMEWQERFVF